MEEKDVQYTHIRVLIGICDWLFTEENQLITPTISDHVLSILFDGFAQVHSVVLFFYYIFPIVMLVKLFNIF